MQLAVKFGLGRGERGGGDVKCVASVKERMACALVPEQKRVRPVAGTRGTPSARVMTVPEGGAGSVRSCHYSGGRRRSAGGRVRYDVTGS